MTNIPKPNKKRAIEFQDLLKHQIEVAAKWLVDNKDKLVSDVEAICDFQIRINLKNNGEVPTIRVEQENVLFDEKSFLFWLGGNDDSTK